MNLLIVSGNVGQDPKFVPAEGGKTARASFSIAIQNRSKRKTEGQEEPAPKWANVTAWGQTAEFVNKYIQKGSRVLVTGSISWGTYNHKETNQPVETLDISATSVEGFASAAHTTGSTEGTSTPSANAIADDSIPF